MLKSVLLSLSLLVTAAAPFVADRSPRDPLPRDPQQQDPQAQAAADMAAMMAKAKKFTSPGPMHVALGRFVGTWDMETRFFMGDQAMPPTKGGEATFDWLMDGRWVQCHGKGSMMGQPFQSFILLGYDNFKMSYVTTSVTNIDTAMLHSEGDMTPDDKALITYGTLDEYLTGEHDKMVRYVWRFVSDDEIVHEVHDLPIGEANTKVVEMRFTRRR